jgi:hypothetical protein
MWIPYCFRNKKPCEQCGTTSYVSEVPGDCSWTEGKVFCSVDCKYTYRWQHKFKYLEKSSTILLLQKRRATPGFAVNSTSLFGGKMVKNLAIWALVAGVIAATYYLTKPTKSTLTVKCRATCLAYDWNGERYGGDHASI